MKLIAASIPDMLKLEHIAQNYAQVHGWTDVYLCSDTHCWKAIAPGTKSPQLLPINYCQIWVNVGHDRKEKPWLLFYGDCLGVGLNQPTFQTVEAARLYAYAKFRHHAVMIVSIPAKQTSNNY